jgi:hypothetical protein
VDAESQHGINNQIDSRICENEARYRVQWALAFMRLPIRTAEMVLCTRLFQRRPHRLTILSRSRWWNVPPWPFAAGFPGDEAIFADRIAKNYSGRVSGTEFPGVGRVGFLTVRLIVD